MLSHPIAFRFALEYGKILRTTVRDQGNRPIPVPGGRFGLPEEWFSKDQKQNMALHSEPAVNTALADVLDGKHPRWRVRAEQHDILLHEKTARPDIVVRLPHGLPPVYLETEFAPAATVEADASARLGKIDRETDREVEACLAVRLPRHLRRSDDLRAATSASRLSWCVLSGVQGNETRWPAKGWLAGGIDDLTRAVEQVSLSERVVSRGLALLEEGVEQAAQILRSDALPDFRGSLDAMAEHLHQEDGLQTSRMAMAIIANAMIFHTALAGLHGIPPLDAMREQRSGAIPRHRLAAQWEAILRINYWPIFRIATDLLLQIRDAASRRITKRLADVAHQLARIGAASLNDLCGRMFQRLITDRKFLATFYTLPTSAALLAELAVEGLEVNWTEASAVRQTQIGDLACGTGTLLLAAYQSVLSRHRRTGGDDRALHAAMIEASLVACDIMPAATHLAASNLSGVHPGVTFEGTRIYTLPYGHQPEEREHPVAIGALDLLDQGSDTLALFGTGQRQARGEREDTGADVLTDIPHGSLDLAIMNPPFTRPTNHESATVPVPSFAGFDTAASEQRDMAMRLKAIGRRLPTNKAGHGNAGLASNFLDLAHAKIRPGGTLALVLPASFVSGASWKAARSLIATSYTDVVVVSIAASGSTDRAFSADTGIAEVLLVAKAKRTDTEAAADSRGASVLFANINHRPRSLLEASELASAICAAERGEAESGWLQLGAQSVGSYVRGCLADAGASGVRNPGLPSTARALSPPGMLRLPRLLDGVPVPMARLGELGSRGPLHRDLNGLAPAGSPRGPFDMAEASSVESSTWPALWAHHAPRERCIVVEPDRAGRVRKGCRDLAVRRWQEGASRLHLNLDFRINSQSLAACLTPKPALGGRAWPSFLLHESAWEEPVALWANTTLGLMTFWWMGTRQQQGRACMTLSRLPDLPVLDPRALTAAQLDRCTRVFADFKNRSLLPANEAYRDPVRKDLDRAVLVDLLEIELPSSFFLSLDLLRDQWCEEPSVHGGKATRRGAENSTASE